MEQKYTLEEKYRLIMDNVINSYEKDPIKLVSKVMNMEFMSIHGPEHHFLDGASFMVALHNNGLVFDLESSLEELKNRTIKMPGAMCGYWGVCGSVTSLGAVFSILDKTGPLSNDNNYASHMEFTSNVISKMSEIGGPRCCKRNAYLSLCAASEYANKKYGLNIVISDFTCEFSNRNIQCINEKCPFHK